MSIDLNLLRSRPFPVVHVSHKYRTPCSHNSDGKIFICYGRAPHGGLIVCDVSGGIHVWAEDCFRDIAEKEPK